jgi:hypothetical protein
MLFKKQDAGGLFKKGFHAATLGIKGAAHVLDNNLVNAGVAAINPAAGAALASARGSGLLEKLKR